MPSELELLREGVVVRVIAVGREPIRLGRDVDNTVVLLDDDVSGYHAVVSKRPDGLHVADLRSTNGTFVNDERVTEALLTDGDALRLAGSCLLRVRRPPEHHVAAPLLVDVTAGTVLPMLEPIVHIGSAPTSHLCLPGGPARAATLMLHKGRELWLEAEDGGRSVAVGELFVVGGHALRVDRASTRDITVVPLESAAVPYALSVALDAPGGPLATLRDPAASRVHTVVGETRATLLFVLARQRHADRAAGRSEPDAGWMDDESVLVAVWGRAALRQAASNYSVLLHRLRRELESSGFDPSFLEKRRGATRLRLDAIELGGVGEL